MVKKLNKRLIIGGILILLILCAATGIHFYAKDTYTATETALESIAGNASMTVTKEEEGNRFWKTKYYSMRAKDDEKLEDKAVIFYPGAKVEPEAYAPLLEELVEKGYQVFLVRMPMNLSLMDKNAATRIMDKYSDIKSWTMMGHSLGGAMAADYTAKHVDKIDNLVLLAAYSTRNLSDSGVRVLQLIGTEDRVINRDNINKFAKNLPSDAIVYDIEGGNHAYFAYYGEQEGDGSATITQKEQIQLSIDEMTLLGL